MEIEKLKEFGVNIDDIYYQLNRLNNRSPIVVVAGEFSAGKSFFINCLLNKKDFLPHGNSECTPVLIELYKGEENEITIGYMDGREEKIEYTKENIERYARFDREKPIDALSAAIPCADFALPASVHIIDTPGGNTLHKEHEFIADYTMSRADLVIYVFNKVIADSDIKRIKKIREYSSNVIYVMTHADDKGKDEKIYTREDVKRLLDEAGTQLAAEFGCSMDDLVILPIGSEIGYADRTMPDEIMKCITEFADGFSEKKISASVKKKITALIESRITDMTNERDILRKSAELDEDVLQSKYDTFVQQRDKMEREYADKSRRMSMRLSDETETVNGKFTDMIKSAKQQAENMLLAGEPDEEKTEDFIQNKNKEIAAKLRDAVETSISAVVDDSYGEMNGDLSSLAEIFADNMEFKLVKPVPVDVGDPVLSRKLLSIGKQLEENKNRMDELVRADGLTDEKRNRLLEEIRSQEEAKDTVYAELRKLGDYIPQYDEVVHGGGKKTGEVLGRVTGEIADIALLLWNPAGAAAEAGKGAKTAADVVVAADKAKDTAKTFQIIKNGLDKINKGKEVVEEVVEEVAEETEKISKAQKALNIIGDLDAKRRKIIDKAKERNNEEEGGLKCISDLLDILSLGFWFEKIGGAVGDAISPEQREWVENAETKAVYEEKRIDIQNQIEQHNERIRRLKDELAETDDFGREKRLKRELEENHNRLEQTKALLEKQELEMKNRSREALERECYTNAIKEYYGKLEDSGKIFIANIYNSFSERLFERISYDRSEALDKLDETLTELLNEKDNCRTKEKYMDSLIEKLEESKGSVEEWMKAWTT